MNICEKCKIEHEGTYGSGRFCSSKCAKGFSTKEKRAKISKNVSEKLKGHVPWNKGMKGYPRSNIGRTWKNKIIPILSKNFDELGACGKRKYLLEFYSGCCQECGYSKTRENGKSILAIHHVDGNKENTSRDNLKLLCPNCHTLTHNFGFNGRIPWNKKNVDP